MDNKKAGSNIYNYANGGNFYHWEAVNIKTAIGVLVDSKEKLQVDLSNPLRVSHINAADEGDESDKRVGPSSSTDNHQIQTELGIPEGSSNTTSSESQTDHVTAETESGSDETETSEMIFENFGARDIIGGN